MHTKNMNKISGSQAAAAICWVRPVVRRDHIMFCFWQGFDRLSPARAVSPSLPFSLARWSGRQAATAIPLSAAGRKTWLCFILCLARPRQAVTRPDGLSLLSFRSSLLDGWTGHGYIRMDTCWWTYLNGYIWVDTSGWMIWMDRFTCMICMDRSGWVDLDGQRSLDSCG